jgi:hypothetical protein
MKESVWNENVTRAIIDSVKLWEKRAREEYPNESCPLCLTMRNIGRCVNCPLSLRGFNCHNADSLWAQWCSNNSTHIAEQMVITLKSLFYPEEEKKEILYHIGQTFKYNKEEAILVWIDYVPNKASLLFTTGSNKNKTWGNNIECKKLPSVTEDEFKKICGGWGFTLIEDKK